MQFRRFLPAEEAERQLKDRYTVNRGRKATASDVLLQAELWLG